MTSQLDSPSAVVDLAALRDVAVEVARRAGALIASRAHEHLVLDTKTSPTDAVTDVDRASEALITRLLAEMRPGDGILGEEGADLSSSTGVRWIVDPLDGTVNFLYGIGAYAVSVAAELVDVADSGAEGHDAGDAGGDSVGASQGSGGDARGDSAGSGALVIGAGRVVAGAVLDVSRGVMYEAYRGGGARRDGVTLRCSGVERLEMALVGTGFGYEASVRARQGAVLARVLPQVRDIRRAGSAALDLCLVAAGSLDGYYESGIQPWDRAAGLLIATESGARWAVLPETADRELTIAAAPAVFEALRAAAAS